MKNTNNKINKIKRIKKSITIATNLAGKRTPSRLLEEQIQKAVSEGARKLTVIADGQHGIGGRLWPRGERIRFTVEGQVGQRLGGMGMQETEILVKGNASDDVGWINCGAKITVLGDVTNGAHNAGAQGTLYVQGGGGARCDTMTKFNPRFEPLQSWYLRNVGDSFAEFKAGGIAVVCGVNSRNPDNILGYRPCVGMVGGTIYFRGPIQEYSTADVKIIELSDADWQWLTKNIKPFLKAIDRESFLDELIHSRDDWKKIIAYTPAEKAASKGKEQPSIDEFRSSAWEPEVGNGGIFSLYLDHPPTVLPYITTGDDRRNRPVWNNEKFLPPCAGFCPSRIPSHKRLSLVRQNRLEDALALVLEYSPFPATVCGQICPNLCMDACTRGQLDKPLDIKHLGMLSLEIPAPEKKRPTGRKIAVIGGGPAGLSAAWKLALSGHQVDVYEAADKIGGKIKMCIPYERLPQEVLDKEISRFQEVGIEVHTKTRINKKVFSKLYKDHDIVVVAVGAHKPRFIPFPGHEDVVAGIEFLKGVNFGYPMDLTGQNVVIIGAGNVGMDIACQAWAVGAKKVIAVDIQPPAAFGKELEMASARGTKILYPKVTDRYDKKKKKIHFKDGDSLDADTVIISIGESPVLDFIPPDIQLERGYIVVNDLGQTSDVKVFAIGDATKPGLVTHAIGAGRITAEVIHAQLMNYDYMREIQAVIPREKIKTAYYETCELKGFSVEDEANKCMSCGSCRDCHMCETTCYWGAISRVEGESGSFEYVVDHDKCIGCGFCAGTCPCGIWEMEENT